MRCDHHIDDDDRRLAQKYTSPDKALVVVMLSGLGGLNECHTRTLATDIEDDEAATKMLEIATKFRFRYLVVSSTSLSRSGNLFARMCVLLSLANQCAMRFRSTVQCENVVIVGLCCVHSLS